MCTFLRSSSFCDRAASHLLRTGCGGRLPQRALAPAARARFRAPGFRAVEGGAGLFVVSNGWDCLFLLLFLTHFDTHAVCPIAGCSFCDRGGAGRASRRRRHRRAAETDGSSLFVFVPPSVCRVFFVCSSICDF